MSKEYGEYGVPGHGPTKRDIRQTLNGVRRLAGNNPIADVLEFRKEYKVVDVSQRNGSAAAAGSEAAERNGDAQRPAYGPRSSWSRGPDVNIRLRYGRQSGEIEVGAWPERLITGRHREVTSTSGPSMKDTIRAARAFFGQPAEVQPAPAAGESNVVAEIAQPTQGSDSEAESAGGDAKPGPDTAAADGPAVARVQRLSTLSMRDVPSEKSEGRAIETDDGETSTEDLLDEIASEIVEEALVLQEDGAESDGEDEEGVEDDTADDEPAIDRSHLFIDEVEPTTEEIAASLPALLVDDVEGKVVAAKQAASDDGAGQQDPVAETSTPEQAQETATVSLRRDRRPGPRLPIDGLAPTATETRERIARGRTAHAPKWSASARHHMTDMLAASDREPAPKIRGRSGVELPRIDLRPDRHRQSSAMILLGLPAMLLLGFGAAYVYHASTYDPSRVIEEARNAIPASIASIPGMGGTKPTRKISESIIQKQEAKVVAASVERAEPLPPPVAPPLGDPTVSRAVPTTPETAPEPVAGATTETVEKAPDRLPEATRIEPAAAPVTSALMVSPAEGLQAEPDLAAPAAPLPAVREESANETTVAALPAPAGGQTAPGRPNPTDVARNGPAPAAKATRVASLVPDAVPLPEEAGETGQLIARGNERMEIGDIAAARLLFELAAQSGSPVAATAMGRSYDPVYFLRVGVRGVKPDASKAKGWYEKAVSGGDKTAEDDLRNLTAWLTRQ